MRYQVTEKLEIMRSVKNKDTKSEILVWWLLYAMGYRYRLHRNDLPGRPDIAFISVALCSIRLLPVGECRGTLPSELFSAV